ncbi:MAG: adenosylcobalamin-dependent ribonucleoside-diphosphate reductase [Oscillibacter sp.]|nr:adenosylcobalamin-dependent ribonucleoside-diphosphate reductase [Oscillibacter sp.]
MEIREWLGAENQLGIDIWKNKYRADGESFDAWLDRISGKNAEVRQLLAEKKFLFGGRILANRGLELEGRKITLSNCYVVTPPKDNLEDIFECAKMLARTYSYGGGCGIDVSGLSPRGAVINNAAKETSGAVSFMELYATTTSLIGQNGRRGALMISLDGRHPDVEEFIRIKTDLNRVTKANLSLRIHDDFMEAVKAGQPYHLSYTREANGQTLERDVDARGLLRLIAETNWDFAEPGALFWDRICGWNLLSEDTRFSYAGVNPCAEEPLPAGGSCLLGSLNLSAFVTEPFTERAAFDYDEFRRCVGVCVGGLNDVLDEGLPLHPLAEQRESVRQWRQIGLGIMGLADMLIKLGVTYGSEEAVLLCDQIGFAMADTAIAASARLAKEQGAYPMYDHAVVQASPYYQKNTTEETRGLVAQYGLRNSQLLTIAPTGTLSTMLGISGGIEPVFANSYERKTESLHGRDVTYKVYTKIVEAYMKARQLTDEAQLPGFFVTARTLDFRQRVEMQAVWQTHIDASISSTVNVPEAFTVEQTEELYTYAYEKGLKGITMYRDGCKRGAILTTSAPKRTVLVAGEGLGRGEIIQVCDDVIGKKRRLTTGCGTLHCMAMFDPQSGALVEAYLSKGSTGGCNNFMIGLSRMISMAARGGIDIYTIVDQLNSTGSCPSYAVRHATQSDTSRGACCPMAVGNALLDMYSEVQADLSQRAAAPDSAPVTCEAPATPALKKASLPAVVGDVRSKVLCPECGEPLTFEGGCNICKNCGWSKCM